MITIREYEIRDASLKLAVAGYKVLGHLNKSVEQFNKNELIDTCFKVSSNIAESFEPKVNEIFEQDVNESLDLLKDLKRQVEELSSESTDNGSSVDKLLHNIDELKVELLELRSAIRLLNAETYSPKLEMACI